MQHVLRVLPSTVLLAAVLAACDENPPDPDSGTPSDAGHDSGFDAGGSCEGPPGLYAPGQCVELATGVMRFEPRYRLWSDDAEKDRFIYLPPGGTIVTDNQDNWAFPTGTRVYKTFSLGGVRLETRLLEKTGTGVGPGVWTMRAYAWNADQNRVTDVTNEGLALRENVLGTEHDIPDGTMCQTCHSASQDVLNGFSEIQLNHAAFGADEITLQWLIDNYPLSAAVDPAQADVPATGSATSDAIGYLHANCGHCHRAGMDGTTCAGLIGQPLSACSTGLRMWVTVAATTEQTTDVYATGVGQRSNYFVTDAPCRIAPADPDHSVLYHRMSMRGAGVQMPPLGTEIVDPTGLATVRAWITGLVPNGTEPCLMP